MSNVTDVEDKIIARAARAGRSPSPSSRRSSRPSTSTAWTASNVTRADHRPHATEYIDAHDRPRRRSSSRAGTRTWSTGRACTSTSRASTGYGELLAPHDRRAAGVGRRARRRRRGEAQPDGLRALEGGEAGRARVGLAVGQGPPGLAHRVLGDVARHPRRGLRPPRRRRRPHVPAPRERARPGGRRGPPVRPPLDPQRHGHDRRREDGEVAGNFITARRRARRFGAAAFRLAVLQTHYRRAMDLGPSELDAAAKGVERLDSLVRRAAAAGVGCTARSADDATVARFRDAMDDDFNTPNAMAAVFDAVARRRTAPSTTAISRRAASLVATVRELTRCARARRRRPARPTDDDAEIDDLVRRRDDGARGEGLRDAPTRSATSSPRAASSSRTRRAAPSGTDERARRGRRATSRQQVEGRRAVRELLVADTPEGARRSGSPPTPPRRRSSTRSPRSPRRSTSRSAGSPATRSTARRAPSRPRASWRSPRRSGPPTSTSCSPTRRAFLVALDGVTDPQNLGAVLRTAETMGATGAVLPHPPRRRAQPGGRQGRGRRARVPAGRVRVGDPVVVGAGQARRRVVGRPRRRRHRRRARRRGRRSAARARARRRGPRARRASRARAAT